MPRPRPLAGPLALAVALASAGCGGLDFPLVPVSGRVTVDGEPVAGLRVAFEPIGSAGRTEPGPESIGITDDEGRFTLSTFTEPPERGAVPGACRIRIYTLPAAQKDEVFDDSDPSQVDAVAEIKAIREQIRSARRKVARPKGALPLRYNDKSELTFEVPAEGTDAADFQLSWK